MAEDPEDAAESVTTEDIAFRDRNYRTRINFLKNLHEQVKEDPNNVSIEDLKHVAVNLTDSAATARYECICILTTFFKEATEMPRLMSELIRNTKKVLLVLIYDVPKKNAIAAVHLLSHVFGVFPDLFTVSEHKTVSKSMYDSDPEMAKAVAKFFISTFPDDLQTTMEKIDLMISYFESLEFCAPVLGAVLAPEFPPLRDFETFANYLIQTDDESDKPLKVAQLVCAAIKSLPNGDENIIGSTKKKKVRLNRTSEEMDKAVEFFAPKLIPLLEKYGTMSNEWALTLAELCNSLSWEAISDEYPEVVDLFFDFVKNLFANNFMLATVFCKRTDFMKKLPNIRKRFDREIMDTNAKTTFESLIEALDEFDRTDVVGHELRISLRHSFLLIHCVNDDHDLWTKVNLTVKKLAAANSTEATSIALSIMSLIMSKRFQELAKSNSNTDDGYMLFDLFDSLEDYISAAVFALERRVLTVNSSLLFLFVYKGFKEALSPEFKNELPSDDIHAVESFASAVSKSLSIEGVKEILNNYVRPQCLSVDRILDDEMNDNASSIACADGGFSIDALDDFIKKIICRFDNLVYVL